MKTFKNFYFMSILILIALVGLVGCGTDDDQVEGTGAAIDYTLTGIEPGAGAMESTEQAINTYDNLSEYELEESSTAGMLTELGNAIDAEEPIVVVGWTPHWKFARYDLKYLDDPEEAFGGVEYIHTIVREGLEEDMPEAFTVLDRFEWEVEDMEQLMLMNYEDEIEYEEAASIWIEENRDQVDEWLEGVDQVDGESFELALMPWDSELASAAVMSHILTEVGYDVTETPVDPAVVFQSLATGDADGSVAPWLPITQGHLYDEHADDIVDLGPNLEGARIGLVVPEYMDIDSIEDLEPVE
ncbi:glycine betaine/proline transport system substrate-binding protein [Pelagirhabdus alkalitolerans]|uniref:Glycine betaine/proline transport system substrate-binding protein n=1 Tax=Pelagirhabdus alkalitolerans TaxID=1612202 RepID=A0A1G6NCS2_9BACI|nr:glycine betaine ABC transporter substrate-binding protein [Pelagirhabdus alkalitolerans]SDC65234.1 glycine betaine/proline transport system substrate-binding protein [Pelagirhabdus alkalitolerans]